eukprot:TRINITY_DN12554_c0_g1_i2.p1 TRINITY_DN12554_c0_g1~~TRINITY_DN12554_c0_g1_i2.p1  ORF type:complete len:504 (+),score=113.60 TRINITY_DN12554_c0_g1_i2:109-1620(+)
MRCVIVLLCVVLSEVVVGPLHATADINAIDVDGADKVAVKKSDLSKKLLKNNNKDDGKRGAGKSKLRKLKKEKNPTEDGAQDKSSAKNPQQSLPVRNRLRSNLLKNYDKMVHPVQDHSKTVEVALGMAMIHVDLDEQSSILEVDAWLRQKWHDDFLTWEPADYENLTTIHFGLDEIWRPDIKLYNSADTGRTEVFGDIHTQFIVDHMGTVVWVPSAKFRAFCRIDLKLWPLETQACKLKFGSWTTHGAQVDLKLLGNQSTVERLDFYTRNKEWVILDTHAKRNEMKYECCEEMYPDITFQFILHRKSPFYRCAIIMPCLVTMLLVLSSFLLPPNAGEKIAVNSTCMIVSVLYLLYFLSTLPALSDQIPLIVLFYSNTLALVGIAIVLNICCLGITREKRYTSPPRVLRDLFSGALGRILCLGNYYNQISFTHQRLGTEMENMSDSPESERPEGEMDQQCSVPTEPALTGGSKDREWLLVAAGLERFFFLLYTIAFAIVSSSYI